MLEEITAPLLSTEWGRRTGLAAIAIFSLFLFITLIEIPMTWYRDYQSKNRIVMTIKPQSTANQTLALIMQLPNQHLFGGSGIDNLPITSLQLNLVGIVQAEPDNASHAIISEAGQPGKIYQVGDNLSSGVHIKAITADGVILENGGRMEKLPLARPPLNFQGSPKGILPGE